MNEVFLSLGNVQIKYYGLMYALAILVGRRLAIYALRDRDYGIDSYDVETLSYWMFIPGILGARLYYAALNWSMYKHDPWSIFRIIDFRGVRGYVISNGEKITGIRGLILSIIQDHKIIGLRGLAVHGAIIGGLLGIYIFSKIKRVKFLDIGDLAAPPLLFGQALGRIGNFANGETHGVPTFTPISVLFKGNFDIWWANYIKNPLAQYYPKLVPWGVVFPKHTAAGIQFPNYPLHPTMLYESLLNLLGFIVLYFYFRKRKDLASGSVGVLYIAFYGFIRIVVSFFRAEDLYFMGFKAPNIASIIMIVIGLSSFFLLNRKSKKVSN